MPSFNTAHSGEKGYQHDAYSFTFVAWINFLQSTSPALERQEDLSVSC